jgi:hypothetical protein
LRRLRARWVDPIRELVDAAGDARKLAREHPEGERDCAEGQERHDERDCERNHRAALQLANFGRINTPRRYAPRCSKSLPELFR